MRSWWSVSIRGKCNWSAVCIAIQNSDDKDAENPWGNAETEEEARRIFRRTYPAVHDYLSQYEERLRNRSDQGKFWWELRACSYYGAFQGNKIIWPDIAKRCEFAIDESGAYPDMTLFVIPRDDEYLLGILNSSVTCWLMRLTSSTIQQGFLRFKRIYVGPIPIPTPTEAQRAAIEAVVRKLLDAHQVPGTSKVPGT